MCIYYADTCPLSFCTHTCIAELHSRLRYFDHGQCQCGFLVRSMPHDEPNPWLSPRQAADSTHHRVPGAGDLLSELAQLPDAALANRRPGRDGLGARHVTVTKVQGRRRRPPVGAVHRLRGLARHPRRYPPVTNTRPTQRPRRRWFAREDERLAAGCPPARRGGGRAETRPWEIHRARQQDAHAPRFEDGVAVGHGVYQLRGGVVYAESGV